MIEDFEVEHGSGSPEREFVLARATVPGFGAGAPREMCESMLDGCAVAQSSASTCRAKPATKLLLKAFIVGERERAAATRLRGGAVCAQWAHSAEFWWEDDMFALLEGSCCSVARVSLSGGRSISAGSRFLTHPTSASS